MSNLELRINALVMDEANTAGRQEMAGVIEQALTQIIAERGLPAGINTDAIALGPISVQADSRSTSAIAASRACSAACNPTASAVRIRSSSRARSPDSRCKSRNSCSSCRVDSCSAVVVSSRLAVTLNLVDQ